MDPVIENIALNDSENFPVFRNLWDFFAAKGNKTNFVSFGTSCSPMVELHFSENLGCKLYIFDNKKDNCEKWNEVKEILKTRKTNDTTSEFAKPAIRKWVIPHNIVIQSQLPTFGNFKSVIAGLNENDRIDVLKIDCSGETTAELLYSMINNGYRPGILMIHWDSSPDSTLESTLLAGHLQNLGYGLVSKWKNNYLYYFTDKNLYEMCTWETSEVQNPLVSKLFESFQMKNQTKE
jgi:hypothetical protein